MSAMVQVAKAENTVKQRQFAAVLLGEQPRARRWRWFITENGKALVSHFCSDERRKTRLNRMGSHAEGYARRRKTRAHF